MRITDPDEKIDPIDPPYRPLELQELKAKGVKVRVLGVDYGHDGLLLTAAVEHRHAEDFAPMALNMLCDMFCQDGLADCPAYLADARDGAPRIILTVPPAIADRLDTTVVPALQYLNEEQADVVHVPEFGRKRTPR